MRPLHRQRRGWGAAGFSLIELLIVVAIILIIAAIAIPNLMRARMAANESSAVYTLKALNTSSTTYAATYNNGFPPGLTELGPATPASCDAADMIDSVLVTGKKSGYDFTYTPGTPITTAGQNCTNPGVYDYTITADPSSPGSSGQRYFFTNETNIIRFNTMQQAGAADQPL
jgi:prepilin-type N-terminal cleavage/methylation domain-containing protein